MVDVLRDHELPADRADDGARATDGVVVLGEEGYVLVGGYLLGEELVDCFCLSGGLVVRAQETWGARCAEVVDGHRGGECAAHYQRLLELQAQGRDSDIELIPVVDAIEHDIRLFREVYHFLPIDQRIAMEPFHFGIAHIMKLRILQRTINLPLADILHTVHQLPVHIMVINNIIIDDDDLLDSESQQGDHDHGSEAAHTHDEGGLFLEEFLVPVLYADLAVEVGVEVCVVEVLAFFHVVFWGGYVGMI